jgi:hypothetical protein
MATGKTLKQKKMGFQLLYSQQQLKKINDLCELRLCGKKRYL